MSSKLRDAKLLELATPSIGYDKQVQAACPAFDYQMYQIIDETGQVIMIPNIMGLTDSTLVDILAWQFHVDFYDRTRDLEFRKRLVQLSIIWHKTKGTPALVQEVLDLYWPGGASILEWYEYMSPLPPNYPTAPGWHDRYRFRILVDENIIDPNDEAAVLAMIDRYKPISRWPEGIFRPSVVSDCNIGWGGVCLRFMVLNSDAPDYVFPAHGYVMSGPATGAPSVSSAPFTVQLRVGAAVSDVVTITPNDNGAGGAFMPASVTLDNTQRSATFTYTPAAEGTHLISVTNDAGLDDPDPIAIVARVPTYTLSGPSGGAVGVASTPFTVASTDVQSGAVTVTPHDGGKGGTFTPSTVQLTAMAPSATFTYTPAASGSISISATNDGGLTDPLGLPYAASIGDGSIIAMWPDSGVNHNNAAKVGSPIIKLNVLNGKPAVRLRSTSGDGFDLATPIPYNAPWTSFMVMLRAAPSNCIIPLGGNVNHGTGTIYSDGVMYVNCSFYSATCNVGGSFDVTQFQIYSVDVVSGAIVEFRVNGTKLPNGGSGQILDTYGHIGYVNTATPVFSDGDIAEIIHYNGSLAIRAKLLLVLTVLIGTGQIDSTEEADALLAAGDLESLQTYLVGVGGLSVEQAKAVVTPMAVGDRANIEAYLAAKYGIAVTSGGTTVDPSTIAGMIGWWKADAIT